MEIRKTKNLKPSTIIPRELYVERGADKQLREVVANMGRPGYVLVARQMGKTNLLLNAKNELGSGGDVFVYVDLSNLFPDIHQFFRNIIDVALDSHPIYFLEAEQKIAQMRAKPVTRPAHKEHEQELRILLNSVPGKIVICLDEIDALGKASYSDSVFSLIRSTYFASRINYPEFNRLTYILSGVVEPNDIIKNKDISPFNIGEKIYLDDFSFQEYLGFLEKAKIPFAMDVVERVFYWTNGNPRMCWDLCSGLEDEWINNAELSVELVDSVVRRLYLTSYNLAPVDHIRQLVSEDKDIRTAVMNIHLNKSSSVTDAQRTKLYLSGIIKSDFSSNCLVIKNKVIEESLSEPWLVSVEESSTSISEAADLRFGVGDYAGAYRLYKEYVAKASPDVSNNLILFRLAECSFRMGDYVNTIDYFGKAVIKRSEYAALYFRKHLWLGIAQYKLDLLDESIETFEHIINFPFEDGLPFLYYEALINICAPYFKKFEIHSGEIVRNCEHVISAYDEIVLLNESSEAVATLLFAAYNNVSLAYEELGERKKAVESLHSSLSYARAGGKLSVIAKLLPEISQEERIALIGVAAVLIGEKTTQFSEDVLQVGENFSAETYAELLAGVLEFGNQVLADNLIQPLLQGQYGKHTVWPIISAAAKVEMSKKHHRAVIWLYNIALGLTEEMISKEDRKQIYLYLLVSTLEVVPSEVESAFLADVSIQPLQKFDSRDARIFFFMIMRNIEANHMFRAEQILGIFNKIRSQLSLLDKPKFESLRASFLPIEYLELRLLISRDDTLAIQFKAASLKSQIDASPNPPQFFDRNFMDRIKDNVDHILDQFEGDIARTKEKKYGRNDRVRVIFNSGVIKEGKYKIFEPQIKTGECRVVSS